MPLTDTAIRKAKPTDKLQRLPDGCSLYLERSSLLWCSRNNGQLKLNFKKNALVKPPRGGAADGC
jgi:hypothetical protein